MADANDRDRAGESAGADRAGVVACYEEHGAELGRFVLGVVRDPDLAGDVMQATLSKALELGHTARPGDAQGLALSRRLSRGDGGPPAGAGG